MRYTGAGSNTLQERSQIEVHLSSFECFACRNAIIRFFCEPIFWFLYFLLKENLFLESNKSGLFQNQISLTNLLGKILLSAHLCSAFGRQGERKSFLPFQGRYRSDFKCQNGLFLKKNSELRCADRIHAVSHRNYRIKIVEFGIVSLAVGGSMCKFCTY